MAPPKKKAPTPSDATGATPDNGDQTPTPAKAPKSPRKPRAKSDLEMPGFPKDVFDAIPAVAKKSGVPQAAITQRLKREYVAAANEAVANVSLTAQDIAREHLAELQAALDEE